MTLAVAILMKDPAAAKTRLADALEDTQRQDLAMRMFQNTVFFLRALLPATPLAVVTASSRIAEFVQPLGVTAVDDGPGSNINHAAGRARDWALSGHASSLMIVHADVPVLRDSEFNRLLDAGRTVDVVIGEAIDGGTNVLLVTPPDAVEFAFGSRSAARHEGNARQRGLTTRRIAPYFLSRDVDHPRDLYLCADLPARPVARTVAS